VRRFVVVVCLIASSLAISTLGSTPAGAALPPSLTIIGHGWGHGRGMGQYGAYGYATADNWTYRQILTHYYGGTAFENTATPAVNVELSELDGAASITVEAPSGADLYVNGKVVAGQLTPLKVNRPSTGDDTIYALNGSKTAVDVIVDGPWPTGSQRWFASEILLKDSKGPYPTQVWNHVTLTSYVEGVVPMESPASWPLAALEAQAVAARSYALAVLAGRASICDWAACQVYGGDPAHESNVGPYYVDSNQAVLGTGAQILECASDTACGAPTQVALTEFSSSTGGWTAGGAFPAVVDYGDATPANPNHNWEVTVSAGSIQDAYGSSVGTVESLEVTKRNGLGDLGGRVLAMNITGTSATISVTGSDFAAALGLRSDWFAIVSNLAETTSRVSDGTVGVPYSSAVGASGGMTPYTWSLAGGSLPAGVVLNTSNGAITGKPTTAQTSSFTVRVTDASHASVTRTYTVTVNTVGYHAVGPFRLFDTGSGTGGVPKGPVGPGSKVVIQVGGVGGIPTNATAVAINITANRATSPTMLTAYPAGSSRPTIDSLDVTSSAPATNFDLARIDSNGQMSVWNQAGSVYLAGDVVGYFTPGAAYSPLTPNRLFDTTAGTDGVPKAPLGPASTLTVKAAGVNGVPSNATAVALDLTASHATSTSTFVTAYPTGSPRPGPGTLYPRSSSPLNNFVFVKVGSGGDINVYNQSGTVDLAGDLAGYYTSAAAFVPVVPTRLFDTRAGTDHVPLGPIGAGGSITAKITGVDGVPASAAEVVLNFTAIGATAPTLLTAYAAGATRPPTPSLDPQSADYLAKLDVVRAGTNGSMTVWNAAGSVNLSADIVGYVLPPG
jgi:SpoIID/LytB domain protein